MHIVDNHDNQSPSAFIPFCSIGSNNKTIGKHVPGFSIPVCTLFKPSFLNGQICYKLDLSDVMDEVDISSGIRGGLSFFMDYNKDRMINSIGNGRKAQISNSIFKNIQSTKSTDLQASIHFDTLGNVMISILN